MICFPSPFSHANGASNFALTTDGAQVQVTMVPKKGRMVPYFGSSPVIKPPLI
jgi:hypothetical protein